VFYAQEGPPPLAEEAAILVLQADGKGVPIVWPPTGAAGTPASAPVRLGKGRKRGGKKEASLTAVYTIAPAVRTPEAVVESLFRSPTAEAPLGAGDREAREGPQHKQLWATLTGKDAALAAAARVARGGAPHAPRRADQRESGPARARPAPVPPFTLVLDLIHATEYLWKVANALLGETNPRRTAWVKARTLHPDVLI